MKRFLIALAALAVFACASDQTKKPDATGSSKEESGLSPVGVIPTTLLHDAQRNKDLDVAIDYPTHGGPFPVIIFSHEYGSPLRSYESLVTYWTTHDFIVIRPQHADVGVLKASTQEAALGRGGEREGRGSGRGGRGATNAKTPPTPPQFRPNPQEQIWDKQREPQWTDRVADVKLVIDSLPGLEDRFPELKGKIDRTKIGVAGHAYGGFTAMLAAGVKTSGNPPIAAGDSRVSALLVLSPEGVAANRDLTAESFRDLKVPAMFMAGSREVGGTETETPAWRKTGFESSPAGDKYFVMIQGARQSTFTGAAPLVAEGSGAYPTEPIVDPRTGQVLNSATTMGTRNTSYIPERSVFDRIRAVSLDFWKAYLKNDSKAKDNLAKTDGFGSSVTVEKK